MSDPYNATLPTAAKADPFEVSLTTLTDRVNALRVVKMTREHLSNVRETAARMVRKAEHELSEAEAAAEKLGAYEALPEHLRPMAKKFAGGAS